MVDLLADNTLSQYTLLTFAVAGAGLVHLQDDTGDVHVGGWHAEVEALGVLGAISAPGGGRALHLHRAVMLVQRQPDVAVLLLVWKLAGQTLFVILVMGLLIYDLRNMSFLDIFKATEGFLLYDSESTVL